MQWEEAPIDNLEIDDLSDREHDEVIDEQMQWEVDSVDNLDAEDLTDDDDQEIINQIEWEDEYNEYLYELSKQEYYDNLNNIVQNFNEDNYFELWTKWSEVPVEIHVQIFKLINYQIEQNILTSIEEFSDINVYQSYCLHIANILYKT